MAKITIKSLQSTIAELTERVDQRAKALREANDAKNAAVDREKETREQFADLKKRLHNSEMEVARINGYLARVREDDTVREELLTVGEPDGQQRLVPKRKPEYLGNRQERESMHDMLIDDYGRKQKPKHWIEY